MGLQSEWRAVVRLAVSSNISALNLYEIAHYYNY